MITKLKDQQEKRNAENYKKLAHEIKNPLTQLVTDI